MTWDFCFKNLEYQNDVLKNRIIFTIATRWSRLLYITWWINASTHEEILACPASVKGPVNAYPATGNRASAKVGTDVLPVKDWVQGDSPQRMDQNNSFHRRFGSSQMGSCSLDVWPRWAPRSTLKWENQPLSPQLLSSAPGRDWVPCPGLQKGGRRSRTCSELLMTWETGGPGHVFLIHERQYKRQGEGRALPLFSCCFFLNFYLFFNWWKIALQLGFDFCYTTIQLSWNDICRYREPFPPSYYFVNFLLFRPSHPTLGQCKPKIATSCHQSCELLLGEEEARERLNVSFPCCSPWKVRRENVRIEARTHLTCVVQKTASSKRLFWV